MPEKSSPQVALVVVAQSDYEHWEPLTQAQEAAKELVDALSGRGYTLELPELLQGGTKAEVELALDKWLRKRSPTDRLLLYWTGHGAPSGHYYLVNRDSPEHSHVNQVNALSAGALGELIAKSKAEKVLVVLDTCYSSGAMLDVSTELGSALQNRTEESGQARYLKFVPSAPVRKKAQEGVLCRALVRLLTGEAWHGRHWTDQDEFVPLEDLVEDLINAVQDEMGSDWPRPNPVTRGSGHRFLPNPRFTCPRPAVDVETRRSVRVPPAFDRAALQIEGAESGWGWHFTGRTRVLIKLATWLNDGTGLVVLTGPPGAGKSAVLWWVVILSTPGVVAAAEKIVADAEMTGAEAEMAGALNGVPKEAIPLEGRIDAAVHAKGLTAGDCAGQIASKLGLKLPSGVAAFDPRTLLERIAQEGLTPTVVLDAMDESKEPMQIGIMLRGLVEEARARVLVGTRHSPNREVIPKYEQRHARLRALFGQEASIFDLGDEADTEADIASYVTARLLDDRSYHRENPGKVVEVAHAVAEKADFLYARVVARTLQEAPTLDTPLPASALEAFVADLTVRFGNDRKRVESLLAALAWAEGRGLSRATWRAVASAMPSETRVPTDADVVWVLDHAGFHILEAGESGQTVYRLAHQSFTEHYKSLIGDPQTIQAAIARVLAGRTTGADWRDADPYVLRHLADHAAAGGVLGRFVTDPGYLAAADPARLLPALPSLGSEDLDAQRIGAIYRWSADRLFNADPVERMAILHLTAHQKDPGLAPDFEPLLTPRWRTRWARWCPSARYQVIGWHPENVTSVAFGKIDGEPVVVSGGFDGTVRLWDARSGTSRGESPGHGERVRSVVFAEIDEESLVVSGGDDGTVRLWDARSGAPRGEPLTGHVGWVRSVDFAEIDEEPVLVSGGIDGTVRLWDARSGARRGKPLIGHDGPVSSVTFGEIDEKPVVVSGGFDGTVRLWDARSGAARGKLPTGHDGPVSSVAFEELDEEPVVISGGFDGTVRLWDARSGAPRGEPLTGHDGPVSSVTFGEIDEKPVVVSGGFDGTVRLWDARSGAPRGKPLTGHDGSVYSVALGEINGELVVVSGGFDGKVRLWGANSGVSGGEPLTGHVGSVLSVALGEIDGEPLVVSGGDDGTVRLWDARSGAPRGEPLTGHGEPVYSVAFGEIDGEPLVVSGGDDGTVRLWDARSGAPRSEPLTDHASSVHSVALGEIDRERVVVCGRGDKTVRLWDARSGAPRVEPLTGHDHWVRSVAIREIDGEPVVVSSGQDGTVRLWDVRSGAPRGEPLTGHDGSVRSVAFEEIDGQPVVVSGGEDGTVRLWDARGKGPTTTISLGSMVFCVAFSAPSGLAIALAGGLVVIDVQPSIRRQL